MTIADPVNGHWPSLLNSRRKSVESERAAQEKKISTSIFVLFRRLKSNLSKGEAFDEGQFADDLSAVVTPHLVRVHLASAKKLAAEYGATVKNRLDSKAWAETYGKELAQGIAATTRDSLQGLDPTADDFDEQVETALSKDRADTIGVTETTNATTLGQIAGAAVIVAQTGIVLTPQWMTEGDAEVCDICDELDGSEEWSDEFPDGPPAHPNCRCELSWSTAETRKSMVSDPVNGHWGNLVKSLRKNCGTGAGGFQPGNKCGGEGGSSESSDKHSDYKTEVADRITKLRGGLKEVDERYQPAQQAFDSIYHDLGGEYDKVKDNPQFVEARDKYNALSRERVAATDKIRDAEKELNILKAGVKLSHPIDVEIAKGVSGVHPEVAQALVSGLVNKPWGDESEWVANRYKFVLDKVRTGYGEDTYVFKIANKTPIDALPKGQQTLDAIPDRPRFVYRGMSDEEWKNSVASGKLQSLGSHNLEQEGLTFYGSADTAEHYSAGFAPFAYKTAPGRDGVVIEIPRDLVMDSTQDSRIPQSEFAHKGSVPISAITNRFVLRATSFREGMIEAIYDNGKIKEGSRTSPSVSHVILPVDNADSSTRIKALTKETRNEDRKRLLLSSPSPNGRRQRDVSVVRRNGANSQTTGNAYQTPSEPVGSIRGVVGQAALTKSDPINGHWQPLLSPKKSIAKSISLLKSDCGTGAGGFQPGNTCGKGEGSGEKDTSDRPSLSMADSAVKDPDISTRGGILNKETVVYRGGDKHGNHVFITTDRSIAAYHGEIHEYLLQAGTKLLPDPEGIEDLDAELGKRATGQDSLEHNKSAIVLATDLRSAAKEIADPKLNPKVHYEGVAPTPDTLISSAAFDKQYAELHNDPKLKEIDNAVTAPHIAEGLDVTPGLPPAILGDKNEWIVPSRTASALKARNMQDIGERMSALPKEKLESFVKEFLGDKANDYEKESPQQQAAAHLQDLWATTSGDHNKWSQAVQQVANEHFGLVGAFDSITARSTEHGEDTGEAQTIKPPSDATSTILRNTSRGLVEKHGDVIRSFLQATYENTQARLKAAGVDNLTLYRGMGGDKMDIQHEERDDNGRSFIANDTRQLQPLSSFATHYKDAWGFASSNSNDNAVVMAVNVPREKIFSTAFTGPGCVNEHEAIVLGGSVKSATMVAKSVGETPMRKLNSSVDAFWKGIDSQIAYNKITGKTKSFSLDVETGIITFAEAIQSRSLGYICDGVFSDSLTKSYSEDEARDESGKWTSGGSSGGAKESTPANPKVQAELQTLGMKRSELPQIRGADKPAFLEGLKEKGIDYQERSIAVKDLKGVQGEYDPKAVATMRDVIASGKVDFSRPVVSSDGFIIDGHHRWRGQYEHDPNSKLDVIQVGLPAQALLKEVRESPLAQTEDITQVRSRPRHGDGLDPKERQNFADLISRIDKPDGGFSYQPVTEESPKGGYVVSPYPERSFAKPVSEMKPQDLWDYVQKNGDMLTEEKHYFGAWHDPESGKVFLDVSIVVPDEKEAERIAIEKDQISYFDVVNKRVVTVNKHATSGGQVSASAKIATLWGAFSTRTSRGIMDRVNDHWHKVLRK